MADGPPVARSPIATAPPEVVVDGWAVSGRSSDAGLVLVDCTPLTKIGVRADPRDGPAPLEPGFGRAARRALGRDELTVLVVGSGPAEWLVLAPPGRQAEVLDELVGGWPVTALDLTHGRAVVRLTGARAADVLAKESAADLAEALCPDGAALRCSVAALAMDLVRDDQDGTRSYLLHCERSSGQYLFDALLESGREFGVGTAGFVSPGI